MRSTTRVRIAAVALLAAALLGNTVTTASASTGVNVRFCSPYFAGRDVHLVTAGPVGRSHAPQLVRTGRADASGCATWYDLRPSTWYLTYAFARWRVPAYGGRVGLHRVDSNWVSTPTGRATIGINGWRAHLLRIE